MVKNISNPINARKVSGIIADDLQSQDLQADEREISIFLTDHRYKSLNTALKKLKEEGILPDEFTLTPEGRDRLIDADFLDANSIMELTDEDGSDDKFLQSIDTSSIDFKTQLESLKGKLLQSFSGGISIDGHELDNFERKFSRPMELFIKRKKSEQKQVSDLQAFAVVYATDQLALGDNSKDDVYYIMFDRFDQVRDQLANKYSIEYEWPESRGTGFIDIGKRFCVNAELAEFGKRFRGISGLDTYPDEVIQVFFYELVSGQLTEELVRKKILYRWADKTDVIDDYHKWFIPPLNFSINEAKKKMFIQVVIAHTLFTKIMKNPPTLIELIDQVAQKSADSRLAYFSKKLEASLTRKSVALQFGTTLSNFFENFKTNPAKVDPFLNTTKRYFDKADKLETVINTILHSVRTGMKNSTGILKEYLSDMAEDDLIQTIQQNIELCLNVAMKSHDLGEFTSYQELDFTLRSMEEDKLKSFFKDFLNGVFDEMNKYSRGLEPKREAPTSTEGGLTELTSDFSSTVSFYGSKNQQTKEMVQSMIESDVPLEIAEFIANASSYMTYQVASKEGEDGKKLHLALVEHYEYKYLELKNYQLKEEDLGDYQELLDSFIRQDFQQAQVLMSLASKTRVDVYNAWTPVESTSMKNSLYLNEIVLPNLLYWQRIPQGFIKELLGKGYIDRSQIKTLVQLFSRLTMIEAYSLLLMGTQSDVNDFDTAKQRLVQYFQTTEEMLDETMQLQPRQGEAEIANEIIHLWHIIQEDK